MAELLYRCHYHYDETDQSQKRPVQSHFPRQKSHYHDDTYRSEYFHHLIRVHLLRKVIEFDLILNRSEKNRDLKKEVLL